MTLRDIRNIITPAPPLAADATVAKAIRLARARSLPALPVAERAQLIGIVEEADLIRLAAEAADPGTAAREIRVAQIMRPIELIASDTQPLGDIARALHSSSTAAVPVVAPDGRYLGMLLRRDLLAAITGQPHTPPIAGLATPFGVYLTTGALRAGANDLALASTGAALMALNLLASSIIYALVWLLSKLFSGPLAVAAAEPSRVVEVVASLTLYGLWMAVFLALLRLSPLTRIHGAEHMVVHAIEEGEDLVPEKLRAMPRVHSRCGTNLMALLILLVIADQFLSSLAGGLGEPARLAALVALVAIVLLTWRRLGAGLQRWVTTRQPSERQLARAGGVGEDLLRQVRAHPGARVSFRRRLWNSGFPQVLSGFAAVAVLVYYGGPLLSTAWTWLRGLS